MATDDDNGWSLANRIAAWGLAVALLAGIIQIGQTAGWFCDTPLREDCRPDALPTGGTTTTPVAPTGTPETPRTGGSTRPSTSPTPEPTENATTTGSAARVVWKGKVLIHRAAGIDLDTAPPSQASGPAGTIGSADVLLDNSRYGTTYRLTAMSGASFADVTGGGTPDANSCRESLQTVPVGDASTGVGTTLCIGTALGNVMMARVAGDADDGLSLTVTQWQ